MSLFAFTNKINNNKNLFYLYIIFLPFLLTGCTTIKTITDYNSKEDYFKELTESAGNRTLEIINKEPADTLLFMRNIQYENDTVSGINLVPFEYPLPPPSEIYLKFELSEIKNISFIKHTGSIFQGMGIGALTGGVLGILIFDVSSESNSGSHPQIEMEFLGGSALGMAAGALLGGIIGEKFIFSFDPPVTFSDLNKANSAKRFGVKFGYTNSISFTPDKKEGINQNFTSVRSEFNPSIKITIFYNLPRGDWFSLNNEISLINFKYNMKYSAEIPGILGERNRVFFGSSVERFNYLRAFILGRMNLIRSKWSPYLILGPGIDFLISRNTYIEDFFSYVNNEYGMGNNKIFADYPSVVFSANAGFGISTGRATPVEFILEFLYNFDFTERLTVVNTSNPWKLLGYNHTGSYLNRSFSLNIGVGLH